MKKSKITAIIGCEGCQTTTVYTGSAISEEDAFKRAEKKHHTSNIYCDEVLNGSLFKIEINGDGVENLPKIGIKKEKRSKGERLLEKIFGERLL